MEYYFNELSCLQTTADKATVFKWIECFAKTCIEAKNIGFKTLRSNVYFSQIEIIEGYYLKEWMQDRSVANRDLQRLFKVLDTKVPLLETTDEKFSQFDWSSFSHDGRSAVGVAVAFLKNSISISFPTHADWSDTMLELSYEYLEEDNNEDIITSTISVRHISCVDHLDTHRDFAVERLKSIPPPLSWKPSENYLPNVEISNNILSISNFYSTNLTKSRSEQIATIRITASQIAELNHYKKDDAVSKKNRRNDKIRDIYKSQNEVGNLIYLSVDVEIGAFEVCDQDGVHIEEILFDGAHNGGQELNHSIQL